MTNKSYTVNDWRICQSNIKENTQNIRRLKQENIGLSKELDLIQNGLQSVLDGDNPIGYFSFHDELIILKWYEGKTTINIQPLTNGFSDQ